MSELPNLIRELGAKVEFAQLDIGDYIISYDCSVERKSVRDLISSIYDGRLFDQILRLQKEYEKAYLLVEGDLNEIEEYSENPKAIYGAIISILLNTKVKLIYSPNPFVSAQLILILEDHLRRKIGIRAPLLKKKKKGDDLYEQQLTLISSLPGVGEKLGKRLLEAFGSPKKVFNASISELARVKGLGYARAKRILKALESKYGEGFKIYQKRLEDIEE